VDSALLVVCAIVFLLGTKMGAWGFFQPESFSRLFPRKWVFLQFDKHPLAHRNNQIVALSIMLALQLIAGVLLLYALFEIAA